jgi:hypothetical protein
MMSYFNQANNLSFDEKRNIVKNTFSRTALFANSMVFVFSCLLSINYGFLYWFFLSAFVIYLLFSKVVSVVGPVGSWFFYFYIFYGVSSFYLIYLISFEGLRGFIFVVLFLSVLLNIALSIRWSSLQDLYDVSSDDLFK